MHQSIVVSAPARMQDARVSVQEREPQIVIMSSWLLNRHHREENHEKSHLGGW